MEVSRLRNLVVGTGASLPAADDEHGDVRHPAGHAVSGLRQHDGPAVVRDLPGPARPRHGCLHEDVLVICPVCEGTGKTPKAQV